ncbi:MAG: BBP7 family outer membrane beta-barrel protein, partial [Planctomycetota bacterium]
MRYVLPLAMVMAMMVTVSAQDNSVLQNATETTALLLTPPSASSANQATGMTTVHATSPTSTTRPAGCTCGEPVCGCEVVREPSCGLESNDANCDACQPVTVGHVTPVEVSCGIEEFCGDLPCDGDACGCDQCDCDGDCDVGTCKQSGYCDWFDRYDPNCIGCGRQGWYFSGEALLLRVSAMQAPPLVSTNPTAPADLDDPNTTVLFGGGDINDAERFGYRLRFGTPAGGLFGGSLMGEFLQLNDDNQSNAFSCNDVGVAAFLGRPFFNINPRDAAGNPDGSPREFAQDVCRPGELTGTVTVDSSSRFLSAAAWGQWEVCCSDWCCGNGEGGIGLSAGYRHADLADSLQITENLVSLNANNPGNFDLFDRFETSSRFNGAELGAYVRRRLYRHWVAAEMKIGLGVMNQNVNISGQTMISGANANNGVFPGGLLSQTSNIGSYSRSEFAMMPQ